MPDKRTWLVSGEATVSVTITVEAASKSEAKRLAAEAMSSEWECDEVDGDVEIVCAAIAEDT